MTNAYVLHTRCFASREGARGTPQARSAVSQVGVLRLRRCFAKRSSHSAQDDRSVGLALPHLSVLAGAGDDGQSLFQVGDQIVGVFNADREPDQLFGHAHLLALLG